MVMVYSETETTHYVGYSFQLEARDLLYASPHRQDSTYHGIFIPGVEHYH